MTKHELLSAFEGVRFLVLGTQGESEYCTNMDAVVSAMAGMDVSGVIQFEHATSLPRHYSLRSTDASEQAARAWLETHRCELDFDGGDCLNAPAFIAENASELLDEIAGEIMAERQNNRELRNEYQRAVL